MTVDPLTTPEMLAAYLQRDLDTATALVALKGASALVRGYCRWGISQETVTMTVDGSGSPLLALPTLYLNSVTVKVDGVDVDAGEYEFTKRGLLRRRQREWPYGYGNIDAFVDHGYTVVPSDIQLVTCSVAGRYYGNPESLFRKTTGDDTRMYHAVVGAVDFTDVAIGLLAPYRIA